MTDKEDSITSLNDILTSPEAASARKNSSISTWPKSLRRRLEDDKKYRRIPPDQSIYSLFPEQSPADPIRALHPVTVLQQLGFKTVKSLQETPQEEIEQIEKFSGQKKGLLAHRIRLALWQEAQQRKP